MADQSCTGAAQEAVWESHGAWQTGSIQPVRRRAMPCSQLERKLSFKQEQGCTRQEEPRVQRHRNILSEFY